MAAGEGGYKARMSGKTVEELQLIDFEESAELAGGGERDVVGLVSLLAICFGEIQDQCRCILQGALAHVKEGATTRALVEEPDKPRSIAYFVRFYAHKLKSTAGATLLWRLAKAAEQVELPLKAATIDEDSTNTPDTPTSVAACDAQFRGGAPLLVTMVEEAVAALRFISGPMWEHLDEDETADAKEELEDDDEAGDIGPEAAKAAEEELRGLLAAVLEEGGDGAAEAGGSD